MTRKLTGLARLMIILACTLALAAPAGAAEAWAEDSGAPVLQTSSDQDDSADQDDSVRYLAIASDRHSSKSAISAAMTGMPESVEYVCLNGDLVNNTNEYNTSTILKEVQSVFSGLTEKNVSIVYGSHDKNANDDADIMECNTSGSSGLIYTGRNEDDSAAYYVYGIAYQDMCSKSVQETSDEASAFMEWVDKTGNTSAPIIVVSHVPMHWQRGDNGYAVAWSKALNYAATGNEEPDENTAIIRDVIFLHGHNHTSEKNYEYYIPAGSTMKIFDEDHKSVIAYTYTTAGYLNANKSATLIGIGDDMITISKYQSGAVNSIYKNAGCKTDFASAYDTDAVHTIKRVEQPEATLTAGDIDVSRLGDDGNVSDAGIAYSFNVNKEKAEAAGTVKFEVTEDPAADYEESSSENDGENGSSGVQADGSDDEEIADKVIESISEDGTIKFTGNTGTATVKISAYYTLKEDEDDSGSSGVDASKKVNSSSVTAGTSKASGTLNTNGEEGSSDEAGGTGTSVIEISKTISVTVWQCCKVSFDPNASDGNGVLTGSMDTQIVKTDVETQLNGNTFKRTGYSFEGWNTSAEGSGTAYDNHGNITTSENVTLYAQWKERYVSDLTCDFVEESDAETGGSYLIVSNGYALVNNNGSPGAVAVTTDGDSVTLSGSTDSSSIFWTIGSDGSLKNGDYYIYRGGSSKNSLTLKTEAEDYYTDWTYEGEQLTVESSSGKTYYIFYNSGWYTNTSTDYNVKLYADSTTQYLRTVTFETNGGSSIAPQNVWNGWQLTKPEDPVKIGYKPAGWYKDEQLTEPYDFSSKVTDDFTLYAGWEYCTCTVTWKNYDDTVLETDENVLYGDTPSYDGETPVKEAGEDEDDTYVFTGWDPAVSAVKEDTVYTAVFSLASEINTSPAPSSGSASGPASAQTMYTVTWLNYDGSELLTEQVEEGTTPEYSGETPAKEADAEFTYVFAGWDPEVCAVTADAVYTAVYTAVPVSDSEDPDSEDLPSVWTDESGNVFQLNTSSPGTATLIQAADAKSVSVPSYAAYVDGSSFKVTRIAAGAFTGSSIRKVIIGASVKKISSGAFSGSKATKLVIKSIYLTKSRVRGSLKNSKIKTIYVKVGKRKANRKYAVRYRKIFTKANAGRKVRVTFS